MSLRVSRQMLSCPAKAGIQYSPRVQPYPTVIYWIVRLRGR
jgi:hypothetical protein